MLNQEKHVMRALPTLRPPFSEMPIVGDPPPPLFVVSSTAVVIDGFVHVHGYVNVSSGNLAAPHHAMMHVCRLVLVPEAAAGLAATINDTIARALEVARAAQASEPRKAAN